MKYLFKLAFLNIIRAKRRTILTFLIISFGVMLFLLMAGIVTSFAGVSIRNMISFDTGDFKIRSIEFDEEKPFIISNYIEDYQAIEAVLEQQDYVTGFTERIEFIGEIDNYRDTLPITIVGINPERENSVFSTTNFIDEGQFEEGGVVIGASLAEDLEVELHDWVYLTFKDKSGMLTSFEYEITGIIHSADPEVNTSTVFISLQEAQFILRTDTVMEIAVKTEDYQLYRQYEPKLKSALPDYQIESWAELGKEMIEFMKTDRASGYMFLVFIVIIALVGTINTMLLSVYEKQREIGMLKAMGMTDREVHSLFIFEGLIIGVLGSLIGIILGTLVNAYFVIHGVNFTALMGGIEEMNIGYRILGTVKSEWDLPSYLMAFGISILTTTLASFYPARKATKMQPTDALRVTQ